MRILIIEDSAAKAQAIEGALREIAVSASMPPVIVKSLADAVRAVSTLQFDLIVLDLMIPYLPGTEPSSDAGYELLRQMRQAEKNRFTKVVSISAYPEEVESYRARFDEMAVLITRYDEDGAWKNTIREVVDSIGSGCAGMDAIEFLIVCALDEERGGFDHTDLVRVSDASVRGLNVRFVRLGDSVGAILRLSQMGLVTATHETSLALQILDPKILAMTGICAGISDRVELGQIVAASLAWEYQAGKWSRDKFEIAPLQVLMPAATRAIVDHLFDEDNLAQRLDSEAAQERVRPVKLSKPIIAPMASGSAVIADDRRLDHVRIQHRKVVALDMETFGVFYAAHENQGRAKHFFSMKTVVDIADSNKNNDLHSYGCRVAALAAIAAIRRMVS